MTPDELRKLAAFHLDEARFAAEEAARAESETEVLEKLTIANQHVAWRDGLLALASRIGTPSFP